MGHREGFLISGYTPFFWWLLSTSHYRQNPALGFLSETLDSIGKAELVKERDPLWLANCPSMHTLNVNITLKKMLCGIKVPAVQAS